MKIFPSAIAIAMMKELQHHADHRLAGRARGADEEDAVVVLRRNRGRDRAASGR